MPASALHDLLHVLVSIAIEGACYFWNLPRTNACSSSIFFREGAWRMKKVILACFNFQGPVMISKPLQDHVPSTHHLHLPCSENRTSKTSTQSSTSCYPHRRISPQWTLIACKSVLFSCRHANFVIILTSCSMWKTAAHDRGQCRPFAEKME